jgi:hypothetical protein
MTKKKTTLKAVEKNDELSEGQNNSDKRRTGNHKSNVLK